MENIEEWKDVINYEGIYIISNLGNIKSLKFKKSNYLKQNINSSGYLCVNLHNKSQKSFYVHRLIGLCFILNPENKCDINHINGIKTDNRIENLEWCTRSENIQHAFDTGLKKDPRRKLNKLQVLDILKNCIVAKNKKKSTVNFFALKYNVSKTTITKIKRFETYKII